MGIKEDQKAFQEKTGQLFLFREWYSECVRGVQRADVARVWGARETGGCEEAHQNVATRQTTISRNEDWIEGHYGIALFREDRVTEDGIELLNRVDAILRDLAGLGMIRKRHTVRISTIDAGAHFWIPRAMARTGWLTEHPEIDLDIRVREWWEVLSDVNDDLADFGIATSIVDDRVEREVILRRAHVAVMAESHPLARRKDFTLDDLNGHTVVCMHDVLAPVAVESHLRARNVRAQVVLLQTASQILAWVREGVAVGFVTEDMLPDDDSLVRHSVKPTLVTAEDAVYTKRKTVLSEDAQAVLSCIRDYWMGWSKFSGKAAEKAR
jgi:DNA-binding transcriptional LysR family regulator